MKAHAHHTQTGLAFEQFDEVGPAADLLSFASIGCAFPEGVQVFAKCSLDETFLRGKPSLKSTPTGRIFLSYSN